MAVDTRYVTHSKWTSLTSTETTYPDGRKVTSGYDALYRRNAINETSGGASIAAWQFFGGRTATVALGNGITCSFMNNAGTNSAVQASVPLPGWTSGGYLGYDGSGRMIAKRFLGSGPTLVVGFTTAYDPSSNKLFERALQLDQYSLESRSALYPAYDSMNRLLQYQRGVLASGGGGITSPITLPGTDSQRTYNLDGLGNWKNTVYTPESGSPTTEIRQHNKLNEITQFATTPVLYDHGNNTGTSYPNRGNGNIVNDGTRIYAYDALNRLITVNSTASGTPLVATYTYDALGRRIQKVVSSSIPGGTAGVTYRYVFDGRQIIEEGLFPSGTYTTLRQFIWGRYIDELIQLKVSSSSLPFTAGTYYPLQDMLYRTAATTDSTGAIKESYDYDAYGNTLMFNASGTAIVQPMCEFLFTGRQYDPETEIYWYRSRYYIPYLARFIARDILITVDPNLFAFVKSNPIKYKDSSGMLPSLSEIGRAVSGAWQDFTDRFAGAEGLNGCDCTDRLNRIANNPNLKARIGGEFAIRGRGEKNPGIYSGITADIPEMGLQGSSEMMPFPDKWNTGWPGDTNLLLSGSATFPLDHNGGDIVGMILGDGGKLILMRGIIGVRPRGMEVTLTDIPGDNRWKKKCCVRSKVFLDLIGPFGKGNFPLPPRQTEQIIDRPCACVGVFDAIDASVQAQNVSKQDIGILLDELGVGDTYLADAIVALLGLQ